MEKLAVQFSHFFTWTSLGSSDGVVVICAGKTGNKHEHNVPFFPLLFTERGAEMSAKLPCFKLVFCIPMFIG